MKRSARFLNFAAEKQTIPGDYDVFKHALTLLPDSVHACGEYESSAAITTLCSWWNTNAPEPMRSAALFRCYVWCTYECAFRPGADDEPWLSVKALSEIPSYAVFRRKGLPPVAVVFCRGRAFNEADDRGRTKTFFANGEADLVIGASVGEVDQAYYTMEGLVALNSIELRWKKAGVIPWPS